MSNPYNVSGDAAHPNFGRIIHGPIDDDIHQVKEIVDSSFVKMGPTLDLVEATQNEGIEISGVFKIFGIPIPYSWTAKAKRQQLKGS